MLMGIEKFSSGTKKSGEEKARDYTEIVILQGMNKRKPEREKYSDR